MEGSVRGGVATWGGVGWRATKESTSALFDGGANQQLALIHQLSHVMSMFFCIFSCFINETIIVRLFGFPHSPSGERKKKVQREVKEGRENG
jgi:hypothetical protein